eukprot:m.11082 g.11082  ORF g.11082 m.11082 type:complete len:403 (+) comp22970_c0_seq1:153-1361(+)
MAESIRLFSLRVGQWKYQFTDSMRPRGSPGDGSPDSVIRETYAGALVPSSADSDCIQISIEKDDAAGKAGENPAGTLLATDVSGISVSLASKFQGDLDTMKVHVIVETLKPVKFVQCDEELGFRLEFTCDVCYTGHIRDLLQNVRYAKFNKALCSSRGQDTDKVEGIAWKEGLPGWICYIPSGFYNRSVRLCIEIILVIYMLVSVCWAVWQLYRNVPLIKAALSPLVHLLRHRLETIVHFFDRTFDWWTDLWMELFRPFAVIYATGIGPFTKLIPSLPIKSIKMLIQQSFRPISVMLRKVPWTSLWSSVRGIGVFLWAPAAKVGVFLRRFQVALTGVDPQVARLHYARMLLGNGVKTIGLGAAALAKRAYKGKQRKKERKKQLHQVRKSHDGSSFAKKTKSD